MTAAAPVAATTPRPPALAGLKVVDFTIVMSGPMCTRMLADAGADVVKIEPPEGDWLVNEPTFSGCLIEARVVGMFRMKDKGADDFKVLGVPNADPLFGHVKKLEDVPPHFLREVEHFFGTYKQLEGAHTESLGWTGAEDSTLEVRASVDRFRASLGTVRM